MNPILRAVVCTVESDSHLWNLVYLQKLLEEHGAAVRNLGSCTPVGVVADEVAADRPDLLVVSSVNGHGHHGTRVLLAELRRRGITVPCVVGGKLTTSESDNARVRADLLARGCTEVFTGEDAVPRFCAFLRFGQTAEFAAWRPAGTGPEPVETGLLSCT